MAKEVPLPASCVLYEVYQEDVLASSLRQFIASHSLEQSLCAICTTAIIPPGLLAVKRNARPSLASSSG